MPHALGRFIQAELDARGWKQADLVSRSGLSRALISKYTSDPREVLQRKPGDDTVRGIAKGFGIPEQVVWRAVARAMGLDVGEIPSVVHQVSTATDDELLSELGRRLNRRPVSDEEWNRLEREEVQDELNEDWEPVPVFTIESPNPHPRDSIDYRRFEKMRERAQGLLDSMGERFAEGKRYRVGPNKTLLTSTDQIRTVSWFEDATWSLKLVLVGEEPEFSDDVDLLFSEPDSDAEAGDDEFARRKRTGPPEPPEESPEVPDDAAANRARNLGKELREQQDREAERGDV